MLSEGRVRNISRRFHERFKRFLRCFRKFQWVSWRFQEFSGVHTVSGKLQGLLENHMGVPGVFQVGPVVQGHPFGFQRRSSEFQMVHISDIT